MAPKLCHPVGVGRPGGVTVGEARALDEAAEMLDEQRLPKEALPDESEPEVEAIPEE